MKKYEAPVIEIEEFDVGQIMESGVAPVNPEGPGTPILPW